MASGASVNHLDQQSLVELAQKSSSSKVLSRVHFPLAEASGADSAVVAVCHVVYVRQGGFMLVIPDTDQVRQTISDLGTEPDDKAASYEGLVEVTTSRGRSLGFAKILLVDFPWVLAGAFTKSNTRSPALRNATLIQMSVDGQAGLPVKDQIFALADQWIATGLDDDTAQDYLTGEEVADGLLDAPPQEPSEQEASAEVAERQNLLSRIASLETQLKHAMAAPPKPSVAVGGALGKTASPQLFGAPTSQLDPQQWAHLQQLAGAPPPRVGQVETRRATLEPHTAYRDSALASLEKEAEEDALPTDAVVDPALGLDPLARLAASSGDPLQQMLVMQLQQNQLLLQRLAPKTHDPVLNILAGSDSGSGNSANIKGCLAREAFQKAIQNLPQVAKMTRTNALRELGIPEQKEDSNLMRKYIERRIPLAEFRTLALIASMLAETWAVGYEAGDQLLMGSVSRMLYFIEQTALDGGKTQLSFLLSGFTEPPMHLMTSSRKKPGLEPFARLCPPAWVTANLSYLRDLDYIETRLASLGKPSKNKGVEEDPEGAPAKRPNPKGKPKGRGKGASTAAPAGASEAAST